MKVNTLLVNILFCAILCYQHYFANAGFYMPQLASNAQLYYIPSTGSYFWGRRPAIYPQPPLVTSSTTEAFDEPAEPEIEMQCGIRNIDEHLHRRPKIIGGAEPNYGAFPWQVEIARFDLDTKTWVHHCGGALLPTQRGDLILTAAHCLQPPVQISQMRVIAGDHHLKRHDPHEQILGVEDFIVHPSFRQDGPYSNDIALIKVRPRPGTQYGFTFTSHVQPICLPERNDVPEPGTWCDVSGWGVQHSEDLDSLSLTLQAITIPIVETTKCRSNAFYGGRQQKILDSMVCAGLLSGGQDACGGDSGGPLACHFQGRYHLTGIVSWGDGCGKENRPGVYTKVDYFADWIRQSMKTLKMRNRK